MERGGNAKVNAVFEARLPPGSSIKPTNHADGPTRERFIRDKYERRKYYDPSGLSNVPSQDFAADTESAVVGGPSVGPPSDVAKQRLEQRRARINKSNSTVPSATIATISKSRPKVAKAPASAPPPSVDLLDLMGGFDNAPSEAPAKTSNATSTAAAGLDLFDFSSTAVPDSSRSNQEANNHWNELTQIPASQATQPPKPALDLSSLYNGAHQQQPMGFANFPSGGNMYPGNALPNQMMMPNGMPRANMQQMTNAMQNMNFSSMNPQQMAYQQQQMMMMQQQQQMRMMMMSQQPQVSGMVQPQAQFSSMNSHNFATSFPSPSSPSPHGMKAAAPATPEKEDPFAQFGTNMFRSF